MRRRLLAGAAGALAVGLALFASLSGPRGSAPLVSRLQAQRRAIAISGGNSLLSILSPPGAGYDSTNVALGTGSGAAVTVSRASTQTCEISAGVLTSVVANKPCVESGSLKVEPSGTNVLLRSEELDNASWTNGGTTPTVTANSWDFGSGSVGETITDDDAAASEMRAQNVTTATAGAWTLSCYMQSGTVATAALFLGVNGGTGSTTCLITGLTSSTSRPTCSVTAGAGVTSLTVQTKVGNADSVTGSIKVGGCQLETGSVATSYIPAAGATASRAAQTTSLATPAGLPLSSGSIEASIAVQDTAAAPANRIIYENRDGTNGWGFYIEASTGKLGVFKQATGTTTLSPGGSALTWTPGTRYRVKAVLGAASVALYRDDVLLGSPSWTAPSAAGATSYIGSNSAGATSLGGTIHSLVIRR